MSFYLAEVDPSWRPFFSHHIPLIDSILGSLDLDDIAPSRSDLFRAFQTPLDEVRVLIIGQDPYPQPGAADGLAFSSRVLPIPASLRNIFIEYRDDLGFDSPESADLKRWATNGVLLLNRTLTTSIGDRNAHVKKGWSSLTLAVAELLAERQVVAILWGNSARELSPLFSHRIESAHPSPLSARRGFFGSRPFSRANLALIEMGRPPVDWKL
jgi:uracil-DNA glycosylase